MGNPSASCGASRAHERLHRDPSVRAWPTGSCIARPLEAGVSQKRRVLPTQSFPPPRAWRRGGRERKSGLIAGLAAQRRRRVQEAATTLSGGGQKGAFSSKNTRTGIAA